MKRSSDRIITSHVGSLPRPQELVALLHARESGGPYDKSACAAQVRRSVLDVVRRQTELGIDVVNEGEHTKSNYATYVRTRLAGIEPLGEVTRRGTASETKDSLAFPGVYAEMKAMYGARAALHKRPSVLDMKVLACTGPIAYMGQNDVRSDIGDLKAALAQSSAEEAFITALSPTTIAGAFQNQYYRTEEEYLAAIADAMREEYKAIVDAGFVVQIDDPRLITNYNRDPDITLAETRKYIATRVDAINYALQGIPEDRVRFHTCYSVNVAPRVHDLELRHYVDQLLQIRAGGYSIEAANPRHEHEWQVWEQTKLPDGKVLLPGVISHCVYQVEHPELVAQRIERFAKVVGRERVIASVDCGFATASAGDEVHPDVAWAKLNALVEGARLATKRLWGRA